MGRNSYCDLTDFVEEEALNSELQDICQSFSKDSQKKHSSTFPIRYALRPVQRYMLMKAHIKECPFYERWKEHAKVWAQKKKNDTTSLGPGCYNVKETYVRSRSPQWNVNGRTNSDVCNVTRKNPREPPLYDTRGMSNRGGLIMGRTTTIHSRLNERVPTPTPAPNTYNTNEELGRKARQLKEIYEKSAPEWCEICVALKSILRTGGWSGVKRFLETLNNTRLDKMTDWVASHCPDSSENGSCEIPKVESTKIPRPLSPIDQNYPGTTDSSKTESSDKKSCQEELPQNTEKLCKNLYLKSKETSHCGKHRGNESEKAKLFPHQTSKLLDFLYSNCYLHAQPENKQSRCRATNTFKLNHKSQRSCLKLQSIRRQNRPQTRGSTRYRKEQKSTNTSDSSKPAIPVSESRTKNYLSPTISSLNRQQARIISMHNYMTPRVKLKPKNKATQVEKPKKSTPAKSPGWCAPKIYQDEPFLTRVTRVPSKCNLFSLGIDEKLNRCHSMEGILPNRLIQVNGKIIEISPRDLFRSQLYMDYGIRNPKSSFDLRNRTTQGDSTISMSCKSSGEKLALKSRFRPLGNYVSSEYNVVSRSSSPNS